MKRSSTKPKLLRMYIREIKHCSLNQIRLISNLQSDGDGLLLFTFLYIYFGILVLLQQQEELEYHEFF